MAALVGVDISGGIVDCSVGQVLLVSVESWQEIDWIAQNMNIVERIRDRISGVLFFCSETCSSEMSEKYERYRNLYSVSLCDRSTPRNQRNECRYR